MKSLTTSIFFLTLTALFTSCKPEVKVNKEISASTSDEMRFDSTLAAQLGADEYGMRKYVMAFLKAGPIQDMDSTQAAQLQRAHLDNIFRLADEGKLAAAGPFLDGGELKGIYIFNVETIEEAKALTETDPAVKAGRFALELHPWYGSAAMMKVNELHKKVQKKNI